MENKKKYVNEYLVPVNSILMQESNGGCNNFIYNLGLILLTLLDALLGCKVNLLVMRVTTWLNDDRI